jgi:hypothetical protein
MSIAIWMKRFPNTHRNEMRKKAEMIEISIALASFSPLG